MRDFFWLVGFPAVRGKGACFVTIRGSGDQAPLDSAELADDRLAELLVERADREGVELVGPEGLLTQLTKTVLEKAMNVELADHLGYERGDPAGRGSGNSRNGSYEKTVHTDVGTVTVDVPRDRNGSFEPLIVPKGRRRLEGLNRAIISLYARGMTTRDICAHLRDLYGVEVSPDLISKVTDAVMEELVEWQNRPLDPVYPILYLDAVTVKVRDGATVIRKAAHLAVGVDLGGRKHILGVWLETTEAARFWLGVVTELRNRGVEDVLIVVCDGLKGLPEAVEATWPQASIQTCVVHLIRASLRYTSWKDRKQISAALRPIYTAPNLEAAEHEMDLFDELYGPRYPGVVRVWRDAWERFIPFLAYPPEIRKVVYTTNLIESINYQLRKVTKNRGHFPNDRAALKLLYLAIRNISNERGGAAGTGTWNWTQALNAFAVYFPRRLEGNPR